MNWSHRLAPSRKGTPLESSLEIDAENVKVIDLKNVKLTASMRRKINELRRVPAQFRFIDVARLAIIVPYRNRREHLERFVPHLSRHLEKQKLNFQILLVEQLDTLPFNRAALLNAGVQFCQDQCDAFCFHDVDLFPETAAYRCGTQPLNLISLTIQERTLQHKEVDQHYFGGVTMISRDQFFQINGFSNRFWGWGLEDDNFLFRCLYSGLQPCRMMTSTYLELSHVPALKSDIHGNPATRKELNRNRRVLRRGRSYQSRIKRGLHDPWNDGIKELTVSLIDMDPLEGVQRVGVDFSGLGRSV